MGTLLTILNFVNYYGHLGVEVLDCDIEGLRGILDCLILDLCIVDHLTVTLI
jgi:hypothetical protein